MYEGLKEYLEKKGFTQPRMAEMLGVSVPYVNAVLLGKKSLGKKNAKKWANLFGLSEHFLLTGEGSPAIDTKDLPISQTDADSLPDSRRDEGIDQSSLVNALLAAKDETIASLRQQIAEQKEMISLLRKNIEELRTRANRVADPYPEYTDIPMLASEP